MSESKFACPHCNQHIACDAGYAGTCIACPSCGQAMTVPALSSAAASRPDLRMVASAPVTQRRPRPRLPALDPWTESQWEEHARSMSGEQPGWTPLWLVCVLGTLIITVVLHASGYGWKAVVVALVLGTLLAAWFLARRTWADSGPASLPRSAGVGLLTVFFLIIALPALVVGFLFLGCAAACY